MATVSVRYIVDDAMPDGRLPEPGGWNRFARLDTP
jgi:hypothetical protein